MSFPPPPLNRLAKGWQALHDNGWSFSAAYVFRGETKLEGRRGKLIITISIAGDGEDACSERLLKAFTAVSKSLA